MRGAIFAALLIVLLVGCVGPKLPSEKTLAGINVNASDQAVLNESMGDVNQDLGVVAGDPQAQVDSAVSQNDMQDLNSSLQDSSQYQATLDPSQYDTDPTV
ncbi:MAG: hypothetical protein EPN86_01400 [Nanoarchaeota archaeon]|nr:MAG: hypothetical protein EPN86_01400 [Nanoarchaeota archaeon]